MEKPELKWEQEVEEEEQEELLRGRNSRVHNNGTEFDTDDIVVTKGHSDKNGEKLQLLGPVNGAEEASLVVQNEASQEVEVFINGGSEEVEISNYTGFNPSQPGVAEEIDIRNGDFEDVEKLLRAESQEVNGNSENFVYFDDERGMWKCRVCSWNHQSRSFCNDIIQKSNQHLHLLMNVITGNQEGLSFNNDTKGAGHSNGVSLAEENSIELEKEPAAAVLEVNTLVDQIVKHKDLPVSSIRPTEVSVTVTETENEDEIIDLDVEGVLEKQNTHDLFCPNCKSCITRRVILRKRKRSFQTSSEEHQLKKGPPIVSRVPEEEISTVDTHLDENPAVEVNDGDGDGDRDEGPDLFRCLSCFSIFCPSEGGFKLFKIFGDKSKKEISQDPPKLQTVKTNWFSAIFSPNKREIVTVMEASNQSTRDNFGTQSSNMNENHIEGSSSLHVPLLTETSVAEPKENGKDIASSSAASIKFEPIIVVEQKLDGATTNGTVLGVPEMNGKKVNDISLQIPQYNQQQIVGAVLLTETIAENENQKVKEGYRDEKQELPLSSTPVSVPRENHMNEEFNNSLYIPPRDDQNNGVVAHILKPITDQGTEFAKSDGTYHSEISQNTSVTTKWDIYTKKPLNDNTLQQISSAQDTSLLQGGQVNISKILSDITSQNNNLGKDTIITVESERVETSASQTSQDITSSSQNEASSLIANLTTVVEEINPTAKRIEGVEIIKSIVYGGLVESITSLGVISSAAGSDASTVNVLALGTANLIGGLFVIGHDLWELKESQHGGASNQKSEQVDRYKELLGKRSNFTLHAIVAVISFFIFGLIPPVTYGFSFRQSNDRDLKLTAVAVASLLCIVLLAVGKAYVRRRPKSYFKTMMYYVVVGTMASGASYVAGRLIMKLLHKLGLFEPTQGFSVTEPGFSDSTWATY